jgi:hypothetical protein
MVQLHALLTKAIGVNVCSGAIHCRVIPGILCIGRWADSRCGTDSVTKTKTPVPSGNRALLIHLSAYLAENVFIYAVSVNCNDLIHIPHDTLILILKKLLQ